MMQENGEYASVIWTHETHLAMDNAQGDPKTLRRLMPATTWTTSSTSRGLSSGIKRTIRVLLHQAAVVIEDEASKSLRVSLMLHRVLFQNCAQHRVQSPLQSPSQSRTLPRTEGLRTTVFATCSGFMRQVPVRTPLERTRMRIEG